MKEILKNYGIIFGKMFLIILISMIFVTLLYYFNILNELVLNIFKILIPAISFVIGGFSIGKTTQNKGYIAGIIFGVAFVLIFLLINLIFVRGDFNLKYLIYNIGLIMMSMLGGMIGINKKKEL